MKVHICKTKKDLILDNFNMIFSGKRNIIFGGAVLIGLVLSFMGRTEGILILTFSLAFLAISALWIFIILRKIKGDKLELTYVLEGRVLKVQNPMGIIDIDVRDMVAVEENNSFYLLEIKNSNGRNSKLPLYKTGVAEGNIDELIYNVKELLNKEYEKEENKEVEEEINMEISVDSDDESISDDNENIQEKDVKEMDAEEKQEKDMKEIEIEEKKEIEISENNLEIQVGDMEENQTEEKLIEEKLIEEEQIVEEQIKEEQIEESEVNKVDTYEIRNIVRFQNKFFNDFKRSFKMQFSRVSLILFIFAAVTMGVISIFAGSKVLGTIIIVIGILSMFTPVVQVYSMRKSMKGIKSIGIDENDDIVIDNSIVRTVYKKKNVAVGKLEDGEIIVSVLSNKSMTFSIKEEEIIEGDPYELFKILKVGKVREFNWLGLFALGIATIGICQIPLALGWTKINEPAAVIIISIASVVLSLILAVMAIFQKGKVKKQANWAILFDIIIVAFLVWMYFIK